MNVVILNGQNHKGTTWHVARQLAEKLTDPQHIREFFFPRDLPDFCLGCCQCILQDEALCPHHARLQPVTEAMDWADVIILASPVYVYHVTGSMKAFLDHCAYRWMLHRPAPGMFRKQAVAVTTAAGGGMDSACRDMADSCRHWGVAKTYRLGAAVRAAGWEHVSPRIRAGIDRRTSRLAARIAARAGRVRPGLVTRAMFGLFRRLMGRGWNPADVAYWKAQGWLDGAKPWRQPAGQISEGK